MVDQKLFNLIESNGQVHILNFWDELTEQQKSQLTAQLIKIDFKLLKTLYNKAISESNLKRQKIEPARVISLQERKAQDKEMTMIGEKLLKAGKVAAFLVAGGQGSRLGFEHPKGMFPITPVKKKSLFQMHAEKIIATAREFNTVIPWYIMTSIGNHEETVDFFEKHNFFGLNKKDVMFFSQEMIPAVDHKGKLLLEEKARIFMNPNGHGGSLKAIWDSGAYSDMVKRGIESIFYFQVDNVLIYICDPAFLGYHKYYNSDMSSKVLRKSFPEEKLGVICKIDEKIGVIEYSDLSKEDANARDAKGDLKYWAGSIAIHVLETGFIEKLNKKGFKLPYHIAEKKIPHIDAHGKFIKPDKNNGFKFETFVFDALQYCSKTVSIEVERANEFSALKNKSGVDSEETSIRDLNVLYLNWLKKAGLPIEYQDESIPDTEISPLFACTEKGVMAKKDKIPPYSPGFYLE
jgi:UDP-N-acetylglucosamine/UDP-N-acetylgalactosamine diphosphorylase